jgi:uncharacterized membrane protein YbhN (UPF0104 family)
VISVLITLAIGVVLWRNRAWLGEALGLVRAANPLLIGSALITILLSYLVSSQVFQIGLRSFGYRIGLMRLWATTITAIVISQSIPAGGVGSYAFFMSTLKRRGVAPSQSALLAALEALSYTGALLLIGTFSIVYLAAHTLGVDATAQSMVGPIAAAVLAGAVVGGAAFALTRSEATLTRWVLALSHGVQRLLRRPRTDDGALSIVGELIRGRTLIATQRPLALLVVLIQILALCGHSFALLLVLWSLHASVSYAAVLAAFGVALITSTFNVLPGGGGTVETVLVAVLLQFGVGAAAVPAAILFRLLNFWAMLPLAVGFYSWLMGGRAARQSPEVFEKTS